MLRHQLTAHGSEIHIVNVIQLRDTQQKVKIVFMLMLCPQDNVNVTSPAHSSDIDIV